MVGEQFSWLTTLLNCFAEKGGFTAVTKVWPLLHTVQFLPIHHSAVQFKMHTLFLFLRACAKLEDRIVCCMQLCEQAPCTFTLLRLVLEPLTKVGTHLPS